MKKTLDIVLIIMILLTGLSLFLFPTVSNLISERSGSQAIDDYSAIAGGLDEEADGEELTKAEAYNAALLRSSVDA